MKIRMLETRRGTEDGFSVRQYFANEEYDVRPHLARAFLAAGWAVSTEPPCVKGKRRHGSHPRFVRDDAEVRFRNIEYR